MKEIELYEQLKNKPTEIRICKENIILLDNQQFKNLKDIPKYLIQKGRRIGLKAVQTWEDFNTNEIVIKFIYDNEKV